MQRYQRWSLSYVVTYLAVGGLGFAIFPRQTRDLFLSNRDYDDVGFRLAGVLMVGLAYLVGTILRYRDGKYYPVSIVVRSVFVAFLFFLFALDRDPMFLVLNAVVLVGLLPSVVLHLRARSARGGPAA